MAKTSERLLFFRQFRERFESTGAILPSSRFLAKAMTGPLAKRTGPVRILEIGPGTGAVTKKIVTMVQPEDQFDLVELNPDFAAHLRSEFETNPKYQRVAEQSAVHELPLQEFEYAEPYDFVISGLPLNNFPADLVEEIFGIYFDLLKPGGQLSYFEYMYVRSVKRVVSKKAERERLTKIDATMNRYIKQHRFHKSRVFVNVPPAWVQHLRKPEEEATQTS